MGVVPDLDRGRRFLAAHPPPGRVLLLAVTGSHNYGFSSPDSDLDLKGIHVAPTERLLGLGRPAEAHDRLEVFDGQECDLTTNEVGRAMSLMLKGNGNMLERIFSPFQLVDTPEIPAMRVLAQGSLSQACFGHYAGYFQGMQREHTRATPRAKSLLYTYRVALTGVHLLRTGEVEAHLPTLAERYGLAEVEELIAIKAEGAEKQALTPAEDERFRAAWPRLEQMLRDAKEGSPLPERPQNRDAVERWLIDLRRHELLGA
ncbi:MAG: nucleotidyltransferase domain-containing protein [Alphaproteobacteria bacterium]|nr:nucleotidyltransferase domain-containing protein [Alphaproteobacteria bacterium]